MGAVAHAFHFTHLPGTSPGPPYPWKVGYVTTCEVTNSNCAKWKRSQQKGLAQEGKREKERTGIRKKMQGQSAGGGGGGGVSMAVAILVESWEVQSKNTSMCTSTFYYISWEYNIVNTKS